MAARNPDSMTNAQGEFKASKPRDEPLTTKGHQPGQIVSEEDAAPEFSAKVLPAGSAPKESTFSPNPINEVPGQADNASVERSHGKENVKADPLDMPGATSGDVHTGLGHPGQGQTSSELHHEGKHSSKREGAGLTGQAQGGTGLREDGMNAEFRNLADERGTGDHGPKTTRGEEDGAGGSVEGSESQGIVTSEELASERSQKERQDRGN